MDVGERFGDNLLRCRRRADLSQEELGLRCSLHRTEVGLLERGARIPRIDTLLKLASGLGVRIDCALLDGIAWTPGSTEPGAFRVLSRSEQHAAVMERAAALRARQTETVDAAELVREAREEMEGRVEPSD